MSAHDWPIWPSFTKEEAERVQGVLLSNKVNYWTGEEGQAFEREFASFVGTRHGVALTNGTLALELAWKALGIGSGDEVIVTSRSFVASATTIMCCGGRPVFADVDRDSQNITAQTIAPLITPKTKAILCVHLAGWPCEMDDINDLARAHNLSVVEDCAQAHGATYRGHAVGSMGKIGTWSFCQDKILTLGGEGGMITTDDERLWSAIWSLKDHGKSWDAVNTPHNGSGFRWLHESVGTNGRMTEMQAAIGRIQLERMPSWHQARSDNAAAILDAARNCSGLRVPGLPNHIEHGWYKCYVFIEPDALKTDWSRDRIVDAINREGVPCYAGSCSEIYLEKLFDGTGLRPAERLPVARELGETSLMFEVHPTLAREHIDKACNAITSVMHFAIR